MTTILAIINLGTWVGVGIILGIVQHRGEEIGWRDYWLTYGCLTLYLVCNVLRSFGL